MHPLNTQRVQKSGDCQELLKTHNHGGKLPLYQTPFTIFVVDLAEGKISTAKDSGLVNNTAAKAERQ